MTEPATTPATPPVGAASPLTAAYCAERAAAAIHAAETIGGHPTGQAYLKAADRWAHLGELMAQNVGMNRPRDDDRNNR